jgi:hypothetical protein
LDIIKNGREELKAENAQKYSKEAKKAPFE